MRKGAGEGRTRSDHLGIAAQVVAAVARSREVQDLAELIGLSALTDTDQCYLAFSEDFTSVLVNQHPDELRSFADTLDRARRVASRLPERELTMVSASDIEAHYVSSLASESRPMAEPIPPGRAGRLWLQARLTSTPAQPGIARQERAATETRARRLITDWDQRRQEWISSCVEARQWGLRATALGGDSDIALAAAELPDVARVQVPWQNTMGVIHPGEPDCTLPGLPPAAAAAANAAVGPAAAAYQRALQAALGHAAAERSFLVLKAELDATEQRRRAIERRRLPVLEDALNQLELRLEELEREERIIRRWAVGLSHPIAHS
jgi:vacuolar-type H+-ATPase subunit D/Vma8